MLEFAGLAVLLGVKHSFDADHLVAVSIFLPRSKSVAHAVTMALSWAAGHMLTATAATIALVFFSKTLLPGVLGRMELLVAPMLVFLGVVSLLQSGVLHKHAHAHEGKKHAHWHLHFFKEGHEHRHLFGVGVVHGLASNDELLLLTTASLGLSSVPEIAGGVALFSLGVALGMAVFGTAFTLPLLRRRRQKLLSAVNFAVGSASVAYGVLLLAG